MLLTRRSAARTGRPWEVCTEYGGDDDDAAVEMSREVWILVDEADRGTGPGVGGDRVLRLRFVSWERG